MPQNPPSTGLFLPNNGKFLFHTRHRLKTTALLLKVNVLRLNTRHKTIVRETLNSVWPTT